AAKVSPAWSRPSQEVTSPAGGIVALLRVGVVALRILPGHGRPNQKKDPAPALALPRQSAGVPPAARPLPPIQTPSRIRFFPDRPGFWGRGIRGRPLPARPPGAAARRPPAR